jgi:hypothetical protein
VTHSRPKSRLSPAQLIVLLIIVLGLGTGLSYLSFGEKSLPEMAHQVRHRIGLAGSSNGAPGYWGLYEAPLRESRLDPEQIEEVRRLRSLGYAGGSVPTSSSSGVTVFDRESAAPGLRYFTSGHAPVAYLMETDGHILHSWRLTYQDMIRQNPGPTTAFLPDPQGTTACWRRARLLPGGEMLVLFEGHGLARIDASSRVIWSYPGPCHHDLDIAPDGSIYVLTRETELVPSLNPDKPVLTDYLTHLSPEGEFLGAIDLLSAFQESDYASSLDRMADSGDIFHTNTLEILDGSAAHLAPAFAPGNILVSVREIGVIAIVDPGTAKVVWALSGMWSAQHQPTFLANGNILLFDNQGHRGRSKVLEINPLTQAVVWVFADTPVHPLFSRTCGSCQRLPGGNTLITESDNGRALEVAPDGTIAWEFRNPQRTGKDGEYIAAIMEMVMVPEQYDFSWLHQHP